MPPLLVTLAIAYGVVADGLLPGAIMLSGCRPRPYALQITTRCFSILATSIPAGTAILWSDNFLFGHLNSAVVNRVGIWSYSIYLIHYIFINVITANWPDFANKPLLLFAVSLSLSCAYAAAIDQLADPYFRRLRRQFHRNQGKI